MAAKPTPTPKGLPAGGRPLWQAVTRQWAADDLVPDAREQQVLTDADAAADALLAGA